MSKDMMTNIRVTENCSWRKTKSSPFCCPRCCWWGLLFGSLARGELGSPRYGWRSPATVHWTAWLPCQLEDTEQGLVKKEKKTGRNESNAQTQQGRSSLLDHPTHQSISHQLSNQLRSASLVIALLSPLCPDTSKFHLVRMTSFD